MSQSNPRQSPPEVNLVRPGKTYLHSSRIRQWLLRKERGWELEEQKLKCQRQLIEEHLERCLLLVDRNQAELKN